MRRRSSLFHLAAIATVVAPWSVSAAAPILIRNQAPPTPILEASPTLAPFQHVRFCLKHPSECSSTGPKIERIELDERTSQLLDRVNRSVNAAISPIEKAYGNDLQAFWRIAPQSGDCNDYAVTKRHRLTESGIPAAALRLSVVQTPGQVGHLVLVVSTGNGDLVLDNLAGEIRDWQSTNYKWLKIQSRADARLWFDIKQQPADKPVAASAAGVHLASRK